MDPARHSNRRLLPAAAGASIGGAAGGYATVGGGERRGGGGGLAATGDGGSGEGGGDGGGSAAASGVGGDGAPQGLEALTREELLRRRSRRLKRLLRRYRRLYWALAEGVRGEHREYWWGFGRSPVEAEVETAVGTAEAAEAANERRRCRMSGCKAYAMPITKYCHLHILMDKKQTLYKACSYVIRSSQDVQLTCGKPVLRAAVPSLCPVHLERAQKLVSQALKKAGFNASTSSSPAPKFHVIIAEYVRQVQDKRRRLANTTIEEVAEKGGKVD